MPTRARWHQSEKSFITEVKQLAKVCGWATYHVHDSRRSEAGWPDLILVHPGRGQFLALELKSARGRVTPEQQQWLWALRRCGLEARVVRPYDFDYIERVLTGRAAAAPPEDAA